MAMALKDSVKISNSAFSYQCQACNKCCHGKGIQVNPYETIRITDSLKITTTDFRQKYQNGQFLKHKENSDACIFLGENGCTIHEYRPLVCRLYQLGRLRMADGAESFTELTPHPDSAGEYGVNSLVNTYLQSQETKSYLDAEHAYRDLIQHMAEVALHRLPTKSKEQVIDDTEPTLNYTDWILDPDPIIMKYCDWKNSEYPSKTEQKLKLHIEALKAWADGKWELFNLNSNSDNLYN